MDPIPPGFGQQVIRFTRSLRPDWKVPAGIDILYPYAEPATMQALEAFYRRFYAGPGPRLFLFGINPGRFGAGLTGVPFTDPIRLETACGIPNDFPKKPELSSVFVYRFIDAFGGPETFYRQFYITSLSPLGFTRDGKNYNYYDDRHLRQAVEPYIIDNIRTQMAFGTTREVAICLGGGQNFRVFSEINASHGFFREILPLPHPRWVMQYRRRQMPDFIEEYLATLRRALVLAGWEK